MTAYGDSIIISDKDPGVAAALIATARSILFDQAHRTWEELGRPHLLSFWIKDWPADVSCMPFYDEELGETVSHGDFPHHHAAWKFVTVDPRQT